MSHVEFPWWEEESPRSFREFFSQARPLFILTLAAGVALFVFDMNPLPQRPENVTLSDNPFINQVEGSRGSSTNGVLNQLPPVSLLGSLFGAGAVDPLFVIPDAVISPIVEKLDGKREPEGEPQRAVWNYLVEASNVGFEANISRLSLALATAGQGKPDALDRFIAEYEVYLLKYASLIAPEELKETHQSTISVLERYVAHLRASRDASLGSVENTWSSPERDAIAKEAARINKEIRTIVHTLGVVLPAGVLP